jgi:hypothetical protein
MLIGDAYMPESSSQSILGKTWSPRLSKLPNVDDALDAFND